MTEKRLNQEQRRQRTKELLLRTALDCFVAKGYGGTAVDEIAAKAGYTKGAFYAHFKNKEDVFFAAFTARADAQYEVMRTYARSDDLLEKAVDPRKVKNAGFDMDNSKWIILVLEFLLHAQRQPEAKRRLRKYLKENRRVMAEILRERVDPEGKMNPENFDGLALKQQVIDMGFSALYLVETGLSLDTYTEMMQKILRK